MELTGNYRHELKYQIGPADHLALRQRLKAVMQQDLHTQRGRALYHGSAAAGGPPLTTLVIMAVASNVTAQHDGRTVHRPLPHGHQGAGRIVFLFWSLAVGMSSVRHDPAGGHRLCYHRAGMAAAVNVRVELRFQSSRHGRPVSSDETVLFERAARSRSISHRPRRSPRPADDHSSAKSRSAVRPFCRVDHPPQGQHQSDLHRQ